MNETSKNKLKIFFKEYFPYILIIILIILIKQFVISPIIVNGESMMKTLHDKDVMLLDRITYHNKEIKRYDIVVIDEGSEYIIKRIIALPGEEISCEGGKIFINGKKIKDSYGYGKTEDFYYKVPKNEYYVLGDNRENSLDSRKIGLIKKSEINGKILLRMWPLNKIKFF